MQNDQLLYGVQLEKDGEHIETYYSYHWTGKSQLNVNIHVYRLLTNYKLYRCQMPSADN